MHRKGSRDSAILNLQRLKRDPSIQKVIVVSSKEELDRCKGEVESLDESFRQAVGYFQVQDLEHALDHLQIFKDILNTLGLLGVESFLGYQGFQLKTVPSKGHGLAVNRRTVPEV